jgi:protein-L-isoaspartate(D-aspartate) O-methyltransferase
VSVLLLSPGYGSRPDGNFGDPHLVALGSFLRATTQARVQIVDLGYERFLTAPDPQRIFSHEFSVVGISCYSSYDYLAAFHVGCEIRRRNPEAILVAGGYHPSARPGDFVHIPGSDLEEPSPFDHVVIGEGELPLARIVESARRGQRLAEPVLGPEPLGSLDDLPPLDWSLLDRYRGAARSIGTQATLSFSRGCPFQCTFCMERSKGQSAWRPWSPSRAEAEVRALDRWLGLGGWTLFIADAVFGMNSDWRREMLERMAMLDLDVAKVWTLSRIDLVGSGDISRYHRANFGLGLGLESGDPGMLRLTGKTHDPDGFLGRFREFAAEAANVGFPWGANVIAGHPGETEASLELSARFATDLFLGVEPLTGFLSVDPFRLYPGSLIDRRLEDFVERFGTRVHRPRWWNYSEQAFTSEWIDPSARLDYRRRESLTAQLFEPILGEIERRFAYGGPAREYFARSVRESRETLQAPVRLRMLADYHLWRRLTGQGRARLVDDSEAVALFRAARERELGRIAERGDVVVSENLRQAVLEEPRERYVSEDRVLESWQDQAVSLTDDTATLSAIHAYLVNYSLLDLCKGDRLLELGGGTGYGAALASRLVGASGRVISVEINRELAAAARGNLAGRANVEVVCTDGLNLSRIPPFTKALFTFAVREVPAALLNALQEGGRLLAPIQAGGSEEQVLTLFVRHEDELRMLQHGPVRYVPAVTSNERHA